MPKKDRRLSTIGLPQSSPVKTIRVEQNKKNVEKDNIDRRTMQAELERRKRRRQSKTFQRRRKSLTPSTNKQEYLSEMCTTILQLSSENVRS